MSLYIGNLPRGIHKDDLESVFRRFGRCTVKLKDGYGFAVYDFRLNAEKALRALKGRNIFGAPISLYWSNQQPRTFQRFARGGRQFEMHHRRTSDRMDGDVDQSFGSEGHRDFRMSDLELDNNGLRLKSSSMHVDGGSFKQNHEGHHHDQEEDLLDNGSAAIPNQVDNDRWGEQVDNLSNDSQIENGMAFDRYEPDLGHEIEREDENKQVSHSNHYLSESSHEKAGLEKIGDFHGNLEQKHPPQKSKPYLSKHRGEDELSSRKREDELPDSRLRGRLSSRRHSASRRNRESDKRASISGKRRRLRSQNSTVAKESHRDKRNGSGGKRHLERENVTYGRNHSKRARRMAPSPLSRSPSRSPKSTAGSGSYSKSRSLSSVSQSLSHSPRSQPKSRRSRSVSVKSKSRSRSSSHTSLSLSVSLGRPLPSPPNKAEVDTAGSLHFAKSSLTQETLISGKPEFHGIPSVAPMSNEITEEGGMKANEMSTTETNHATAGESSGIRHVLSPATAKEVHVAEGGPMHGKQLFQDAPPICLVPNAGVEDVVLKTNEFGDNGTNQVIPTVSSEIETLPLPPLEEDASTSLKYPRALELDNILEANERSDPKPSSVSCVRNLDFSPEELCRALKHYGLKYPEKSESHLATGDYFGACRLWPWEIVYYRKLKKGPISTENYARRVAQNKEFGIADKYIRSSSGWGELNSGLL